MEAEPALEVDDIQGHVLVGFGGQRQLLLGLRLSPDRLEEARATLRPCVAQVTSTRQAAEVRKRRRAAVRAGEPPPAQTLMIAVGISQPGLVRLSAPSLPSDPLFLEGASKGAAGLGDRVDATGSPLDWVVGGTPEQTPDLFFVVDGPSGEVSDWEESFCAALGESVTLVYREIGERLPENREHFGFVDGISQPGFRGLMEERPLTPRLYAPNDPHAALYARPGQPLVWPGQFVFGYATQRVDGPAPGAIAAENDDFLRNGSLLVFRRLRQDVPAFRNAMATLAENLGDQGLDVDAAHVAALCVGRWPDGTPVSLSPDCEDPDIHEDPHRRNGFLYDTRLPPSTLIVDGAATTFKGAEADSEGLKCPFFAHIRKVNPRDQVVDQGSSGITLRSQLLRRGIPYGPTYSDEPDEADRGLLFLAYQTSIANQFHRLMTLWVNNTFAPPPGEGEDPLIGASPKPHGRPLTRRGANRVYRSLLPGSWVEAQGAGYFFVPGIRSLTGLFA